MPWDECHERQYSVAGRLTVIGWVKNNEFGKGIFIFCKHFVTSETLFRLISQQLPKPDVTRFAGQIINQNYSWSWHWSNSSSHKKLISVKISPFIRKLNSVQRESRYYQMSDCCSSCPNPQVQNAQLCWNFIFDAALWLTPIYKQNFWPLHTKHTALHSPVPPALWWGWPANLNTALIFFNCFKESLAKSAGAPCCLRQTVN